MWFKGMVCRLQETWRGFEDKTHICYRWNGVALNSLQVNIQSGCESMCYHFKKIGYVRNCTALSMFNVCALSKAFKAYIEILIHSWNRIKRYNLSKNFIAFFLTTFKAKAITTYRCNEIAIVCCTQKKTIPTLTTDNFTFQNITLFG